MSPFDRGRPRRATVAQAPPSTAGLYRKLDKRTGKILYHGETSNLRRRYNEHVSQGKIDHSEHNFDYKEARKGSNYLQRRAVETKKIERDSPLENLCAGGGGRAPVERHASGFFNSASTLFSSIFRK
jgi:GIY-YIG catalytic domain